MGSNRRNYRPQLLSPFQDIERCPSEIRTLSSFYFLFSFLFFHPRRREFRKRDLKDVNNIICLLIDGKRDRFINKIVNSFVLIIIGESLSLYYIFASRTRVPILVRATILVTILQWPIILFARPGLFYSTCPTITVYLTMTDLLHCRSITIFISPYPPLPGIMKTKTRLFLLCRLNFIQRCFVDSTFLFTIRFDSIRFDWRDRC